MSNSPYFQLCVKQIHQLIKNGELEKALGGLDELILSYKDLQKHFAEIASAYFVFNRAKNDYNLSGIISRDSYIKENILVIEKLYDLAEKVCDYIDKKEIGVDLNFNFNIDSISLSEPVTAYSPAKKPNLLLLPNSIKEYIIFLEKKIEYERSTYLSQIKKVKSETWRLKDEIDSLQRTLKSVNEELSLANFKISLLNLFNTIKDLENKGS